MQTNVERVDTHKVKLRVEVDVEELAKDLDRAYREVANQVRIPGFRKGKVPKKVIDAQVGRETVLGEFLEDAVPGYYREALRENDLAPITDPDLDVEQLEEGKPFVFTATVEVRPRLVFEPSEYRAVEVERPAVAVSDEEVDRMLDSLRDRFAELEPVTRPARSGDYVVMDVRATIHGEEVPEGTRTDHLYEVGSGELGAKVDAELEGKRAGEILKVNDVLPESAGERAGREVSFQVLVKEVKGKKLPDLDDAFARTASEFDSLDELRGALRGQIGANKERAADAEVRDRVLARMIDRVDVELPETLVDQETEHRVLHARERAERIGVTLDQLLSAQGMDEPRFRADARDHSVRAIKADLVLEAVARAEDLQVTAEEIGAEIAGLAASLGREPEDVAKTLDRTGQVVSLAGDIIRSKALDVLVEHASVGPEGGPPGVTGPPEPSETETAQQTAEEAS